MSVMLCVCVVFKYNIASSTYSVVNVFTGIPTATDPYGNQHIDITHGHVQCQRV